MARGGSVKVVFHIKGPGGFTQPRMRGYRRLYIEGLISPAPARDCPDKRVYNKRVYSEVSRKYESYSGMNGTREHLLSSALISCPLYRQFRHEKVSRNYGVLIPMTRFPPCDSLECLSAVSAVVSSLFTLHDIDSVSPEGERLVLLRSTKNQSILAPGAYSL